MQRSTSLPYVETASRLGLRRRANAAAHPTRGTQPPFAARLQAGLSAWVTAESGRFILFLPVFMAAGIILYFGLPFEPPASPAQAMAAILLPAGLCARAWPMAQAALLCAGFAATGFASAQHETARAPAWTDLPHHAIVVTGTIGSLDILPNGRRVTIEAPSLDGLPALPRSVRVRLQNKDEAALAPGDRVTIRALLRTPSPPAYPGGWDTQRDAYFSNLAGSGFAIGAASRTTVGPSATPPAAGWHAIRSKIASRILAALPGSNGAIAATLLTGMGAAIPPADRAAFQDSGLAHLLAVAGLHIGITMGLVYAACRRGLALWEHAALAWPVKQISAALALAAGFAYLELTGAHVPILRSFAMACLVTLALILGRRAISMRGLALAAVLLMIASPDLVMGVSFQMSFAAVLALIAGWEALSPRLAGTHGPGWWRAPLRHLIALLATSALAGTASLPVAAYHFGNATSYYVPANLLAVPLTAFWVMPLGLAALLLMPFGLHGLALTPMGWGIGAITAIAHAVAAWPHARVAVPQIPPAALLTAMAGLVWLCLWRTRIRLAGLAAIAASLAVAALTPSPDLVVNADAKLIAARIGSQVYVSASPGLSRYDKEIPQRIWGIATLRDFPADGPSADGAVLCTPAACTLSLHGQTATLLRNPNAACLPNTVAVSHLRIACPSATLVDSATTARHGATTIRLTQAGPVLTTDDARGARPWVYQPFAAAIPGGLPAALGE